MKGISVVIPTLERTSFLVNTLRDLIVQKIDKPFEVLIIDQSEQEDTIVLAFAKAHSNIKYHHITDFKGLPEARNYGASKALYEYLLYLDDDIHCESNLLKEHYSSLTNTEIALVAGGITEQFATNIDCEVGKFVQLTATPLRGFHQDIQQKVDHAGGGNFSIKKHIYHELGGVDENLTKGAALYEETDLCLRLKNAGHTIHYNYKAHVYHLAAQNGGCRVPDIRRYIYTLSRNRSMIIQRYLPWYYKFTAHAYLIKLILAYMNSYRDITLFKSYLKGKKEGKEVALRPILNTSNTME